MSRNKRSPVTNALPHRRTGGRAKRASHVEQLPIYPPRVQRLIAVLAQIEMNPAPDQPLESAPAPILTPSLP